MWFLLLLVPRSRLRESRRAVEGAARIARGHEDVTDVPAGAEASRNEAAICRVAAPEIGVVYRSRKAGEIEKIQID